MFITSCPLNNRRVSHLLHNQLRGRCCRFARQTCSLYRGPDHVTEYLFEFCVNHCSSPSLAAAVGVDLAGLPLTGQPSSISTASALSRAYGASMTPSRAFNFASLMTLTRLSVSGLFGYRASILPSSFLSAHWLKSSIFLTLACKDRKSTRLNSSHS